MKYFCLCLVLSAILHICAAWLNEGYFHPDDHYQILEFGAYKLGITPQEHLAWEYKAQIRPAFQPAIVFVVHRIGNFFGLTNPFIFAIIFRIFSGIFGFAVTLNLCLFSLKFLKSDTAKKILILFSFLFFAVPHLHCRFSSENFGAMFFISGILLLPFWNKEKFSITKTITAGFFLGFAFWCRFQLGFALAGIGAWIILINRPIKVKAILLILIGFLLAVFINIILDRWFYGTWILTPKNYFIVNIIQNKAAEWGVKPWYFYLAQLIALLIPPFSFVLVGFILAACWFFRKHIFIWALIPFMIAHSLVGHKEIRFMFPLLYLLGPLIAFGADSLTDDDWWKKKPVRISVKIFAILNIILLVVFTFKPAQECVGIFKWLYAKGKQGNIHILNYKYNNGELIESQMYYYRPANYSISNFETAKDLESAILKTRAPVYVFIEQFGIPQKLIDPNLAWEIQVCSIPHWLKYFNVNNWLSRIKVWNIYKVYLKK